MRALLATATCALTLPLSAEPAPRWDHSAVEGAGVPPFDYEVAELLPGLEFPRPVHADTYIHDGNPRLLIACRNGELFDGMLPPFGENLPRLADNVADHLHPLVGHGEGGKARVQLYSTLLDTDYRVSRHLYVFARADQASERHNGVWRLTITPPGTPSPFAKQKKPVAPLAITGAEAILTWKSDGHDGGDLAWGPDGMLYVSAGDRSAPGDPNNWGQRTDDIFGSILRIDVRGDKVTPYAIPPDNPFVGIENVRPEIWAYGLRNPWRFAFHPDNGELWIGDNGDESWELIHRTEKGSNAGWSAFEGSAVFRPGNSLAGPTLTHTPAIVQHPHREMRSVIGGYFYRGKKLPKLRSHYLYGCYFTKRLWAFSYQDGQAGTPFLVADAGGAVVSITEGHDREPIITCHDGKVFRLRAKTEAPTSKPWPAALSATGLFTDTARQSPARGVYPYETNAKSWSDGAERQHFVAITATGSGQMSPTGGAEAGRSWNLPEGSIVGQTLSLHGKKVETQLLHFDGSWRGYTYRWNAEGKDASLVPETGLDTEIDGQKWRFMSRAECMSCHTHRTNFTLSFRTPQLDRPGADGETNQVDRFIELGLFKNAKAIERERGTPTPDPHDETIDLDTRARTYLELNCAHCHQEAGLGGRAGFQLLAKPPLEETGILNAKPLVGLTGNPDAKVLAPGKPELSELLTRMSRRGPGQMPLVGSHQVDERGVALIREWIESLGEK